MKFTFLTGICVAFSLLSGTAWADWERLSAKDFEMVDYPKAGSQASKEDYALLLEFQRTRTREQCRQGQRMKYPQYSILFKSEILGPDEMQITTPLMDRVGDLALKLAQEFKVHYDRPRPYDADSRVHPCISKPEGSKAYPSGHATIASAISCVLIEVFPDKESDLKAFGKEIGDLRAICGVHHPSDVKAGQKLGQDLCERLKTEPDFIEELKNLKKAAHQLENTIVPTDS